MENFADRLQAAIKLKKTPLIVGLDPRFENLPAALRKGIDPNDLEACSIAYKVFCRAILDVVHPLVPAVKPQAAFFEQLGPYGMIALHDVIEYANKLGLIVILDAKRGDIGSTAAAYAAAFLGRDSAWRCHALTVNPYLGEDSLTPFVDVAAEQACGVFVLVKTSNPGGRMLQDLVVGDKALYSIVADHVQHLAAANKGQCGYGHVGTSSARRTHNSLPNFASKCPTLCFSCQDSVLKAARLPTLPELSMKTDLAP